MASAPRKQTVVRPAVPEDAAPVAKLGAHVFALSFGHAVPPDDLDTYLKTSFSAESILEDISNPNKDMIVATSPDGTVVGFGLLTRGTTEDCIAHINDLVELQRVYVDPGYHSNGVGSSLIAKLEDMAREQGFKHIWLGAWTENPRAQKLYEKIGFRVVGSHGFPIGGAEHLDHIMLKEL